LEADDTVNTVEVGEEVSMTLEDRNNEDRPTIQRKYPLHPLAMENTPEETMRRMQAFPERAAKFREMIRALREREENAE
jgi:hypothetical protein